MARERYVPTPAEVDEGFDPGIRRERRGPFKKLREAIAPKRVAKHNVLVPDSVGESRVMAPAPRIEPMRSVATTGPDAQAIQPVAARTPRQRKPAESVRSAAPAPAASPAPQRRARRTRVADDVLPSGPSFDSSDPDSRVGSWEPGLSMGEMQ